MTDIDPLSKVRASYDRWAAVYDSDANPLVALEEPLMRQAVGNVRGSRVLDLGCGTGRHAIWLAEAGAVVTAADFSQGMINEAIRKSRGSGVSFLLHDFKQPLPFRNSQFDLLVSGLVLEHVHDLQQFMREARRVIRPGGRAVISAMHPAMFLRGSQARFTDPVSGEIVKPGSMAHTIADFVMAPLRAGLSIDDLVETAPDSEFARVYPRAEKYVEWPMLVIMQLRVSE
jgi:ubiquinone/menaquinone biosynthesis C-methylase UbiE